MMLIFMAATQAYTHASQNPKCPKHPFQATESNTTHPVAQLLTGRHPSHLKTIHPTGGNLGDFPI